MIPLRARQVLKDFGNWLFGDVWVDAARIENVEVVNFFYEMKTGASLFSFGCDAFLKYPRQKHEINGM